MRQPWSIRKILDPSEALVVAPDNATKPDVTSYIDSSGLTHSSGFDNVAQWTAQSQGLSTNCCSFILHSSRTSPGLHRR